MPPDAPDWSYHLDAPSSSPSIDETTRDGDGALSHAAPMAHLPSIPEGPIGRFGTADDAPRVPRPKPPIRPERAATDEHEGWRTDGLHLRRANRDAYYLSISPAQGAPQTLFLRREQLARLAELTASPTLEPGHLWRLLSDIPMERPLPSRRLDAELRALLATFALEILR